MFSQVFLPVLNYKDFIFFKENMKGVLCNRGGHKYRSKISKRNVK